MVNKDYAIIVAGGKGNRMGADVPKQFLKLGGRPILMHTLKRFRDALPTVELILVLPADCIEEWKTLCEFHHFEIDTQIAIGGATRFDSVKSGLTLIPDKEGVVGIHDGVRPFVDVDVIRRCYAEARKYGAVVPVLQPVESVRIDVGEEVTEALDRSKLYFVQTPQTFSIQLLKKAYRQTYHSGFTDDASVVEAMGEQIHLVQGNRENIKLTTPFDLIVGEAIMGKDKERSNKR